MTTRNRRAGVERGEGDRLVRWLAATYGEQLRQSAVEVTGCADTAEAVVNEALLRAWWHWDALRGRRISPRRWLSTVARNLALDHVRSCARAARIQPASPPTSPVPDHAGEVVEALVLDQALKALSAEHRTVIVESYFRGRTAVEVAEVLGIPVGTVKSRTFYGIRALRAVVASMPDVDRPTPGRG